VYLLRFTALQVLDLNDGHLTDTKQLRRSVTFSCLPALRLQQCAMELTTLQDVVSASLALTGLRLKQACISTSAAQQPQLSP
jgi:hypothetical protein